MFKDKNILYLESEDKSKSIQSFIKKFQEKKSGRYVLGRNILASKLLDIYEVDGVIDDFANIKFWNGVKVVKLIDVEDDAIIVNCSGGKTLTVRDKLEKLNLENLDYFSFSKYCDQFLPEMPFNENFASNYIENLEKFNWIRNLLDDDLSRTIFDKLINFRRSYTLEFLEGFEDREKFQYFEDFLKLDQKVNIFADVGGYDGFTTEEFLKKSKKGSKSIIFEPEISNYNFLKKKFEQTKEVNIINCALGDRSYETYFDSSGSTSKQSSVGLDKIKVEKFDDLDLDDMPTIIKMDIEGMEKEAILGAKNTILKYFPTLIISGYHKINDFWEIPKLIFSISKNYSVKIRHYTETTNETVLFFIPK